MSFKNKKGDKQKSKAKLLKSQSILDQVRPTPVRVNSLSSEQKINEIEKRFAEIMEILGLDLSNDSLHETPKRIAKMYVTELFSGLNPQYFPKITLIDNSMAYDQMIVVQDIGTLSVCEHHFLTIDGVATIAYIPQKKVIGLSKISRIVQFFSRRPQVQERLTKQIADCLGHVLETPHLGVHIIAKHYCMIARGVSDSQSCTATSDLRGDFKNKIETREEFLGHCRKRANN